MRRHILERKVPKIARRGQRRGKPGPVSSHGSGLIGMKHRTDTPAKHGACALWEQVCIRKGFTRMTARRSKNLFQQRRPTPVGEDADKRLAGKPQDRSK